MPAAKPKTLYSSMMGRRVKVSGTFQPDGPQAKYHALNGKWCEIVNVYLDKDGSPMYDLLTPEGKIAEGLYAWGFQMACGSEGGVA